MKADWASGAEGRLQSGRHNLSRAAVVGSQRARILEAVAETCAERGYAATTIAHIVDRAGVSRATFYELFRDKEDCFLAAANAILGETIAAVTDAYSLDKPLFQVVEEAAAAILALMAERPAFAQLAFLDYRSATPRAIEVYKSGTRVLVSLLDQLRGDAPENVAVPSSAARAAVGGAEALIRREVAAGRAQALPQRLPELVYGLLVPFLGIEEAAAHAASVRGRAQPSTA